MRIFWPNWPRERERDVGKVFFLGYLALETASGLKDWLVKVKEDSSSARCSLHKKMFSIANSGVSQVISHSTGALLN